MTTDPLNSDELDSLAHPDRGYCGDPLWSEILPDLWMGGTADTMSRAWAPTSQQLRQQHFDTVVTLYAWAGPVDWYVKEVRLGFFDHSEVDLDEHDLAHAVRAAYRDWKRGKRVLVRCQAGWNRSGLIMALVLMLDGLSPDEGHRSSAHQALTICAVQLRLCQLVTHKRSGVGGPD
jgi:hypothetical protein